MPGALNGIHAGELAEFTKIFKDYGLSRIDDRLKVLEAFLGTENHVTAKELAERLGDLDEEFVAETLEILAGYGFAQRAVFDGQPTRYEHRHLDLHHDHLVCARCGGIEEFHNEELEALKERVAREQGFMMLTHKTDLYGLCKSCQEARRELVPLTDVSPGERVRVMGHLGGRQMAHRAAEMGLLKGQVVKVIKSEGPGPVVLAVMGSRVAVGRSMAAKVQVSPASRRSPRFEPS